MSEYIYRFTRHYNEEVTPYVTREEVYHLTDFDRAFKKAYTRLDTLKKWSEHNGEWYADNEPEICSISLWDCAAETFLINVTFGRGHVCH